MFRFLFWFTASVIMAYFMTDIKIGGHTIKELIDGLLKTQSGIELKEKAKSLVDMGLGEVVNKVVAPDVKKAAPTMQSQAVPDVPKNPSESKDAVSQPAKDSDDLRPEDERELEKILKEHH